MKGTDILKKILAAVLAASVLFTFSGCRQSSPPNGMTTYDFKKMNTDYIQLKPPSAGDKIAVIDTDYGEIRVVLYEQYAPKTVLNFIKNAEAGKYNDMPVKGVAEDTYFLTGGYEDEKGNYIGRETDEQLIDNEYSVDLWPFSGALMAYSEKAGQSDARWFIVNNDAESLTEENIKELKDSAQKKDDPDERENIIKMFDTFYEMGGVFGLAGENTVFGQTYLGLDVVQKLTKIPADDDGAATETVMIKSVTISEFKNGDKTDDFPRTPIHPSLDNDTSAEGSSAADSGEGE